MVEFGVWSMEIVLDKLENRESVSQSLQIMMLGTCLRLTFLLCIVQISPMSQVATTAAFFTQSFSNNGFFAMNHPNNRIHINKVVIYDIG